MSEVTHPLEVESPVSYYNTHEKRYGFHYLNTVVKLYGDPGLDRVDYYDGPQAESVYLPEPLFDSLLDQNYRFTYFPDETVEKYWYNPQAFPAEPDYSEHYEGMTYTAGQVDHVLKWTNSRLRIFGQSEYNHIEVRVGNELRGIFKPPEWVMSHLFRHDFPIEYLPLIEMDAATKKWYDDRVTQLMGDVDGA